MNEVTRIAILILRVIEHRLFGRAAGGQTEIVSPSRSKSAFLKRQKQNGRYGKQERTFDGRVVLEPLMGGGTSTTSASAAGNNDDEEEIPIFASDDADDGREKTTTISAATNTTSPRDGELVVNHTGARKEKQRKPNSLDKKLD